MKKKTLLILLAGCLFLTGCNKDNKRKTQLKNAGTDYYQTYMSGVSGIDKADVTLYMLKKANNSGNKEYKLKSLEGCKGSTKITFTIEKNKITGEEYELKCEK